MSTDLQNKYRQLRDSVIDGTASQQDVQRLEELVLNHEELRQDFVSVSTIHGELCARGIEQQGLPLRIAQNMPAANQATKSNPGRPGLLAGWIAACAVVIAAVASLWTTNTRVVDTTFAELTSTRACLWVHSPSGTSVGQRFGTCDLQLAQGVASVRLDNGTVLDLEGPALVSIVDPMHCELKSGSVVVTVAEGMQGYIVDTPYGTLLDQGTSFGVAVRPSGESVVEVFDGQVDVTHKMTGQLLSVKESFSARIAEMSIENQTDTPRLLSSSGRRATQITTGMGAGRDFWVQRDESQRKGPDNLLLAKNALRGPYEGYDRQIRLRFDLSFHGNQPVSRATLQITGANSELGFASRTPDSTFAVYGRPTESNARGAVVDRSQDWFVSGGHHEAILLGRFVVPASCRTGTFTLESPGLTQFVAGQTGQVIECIVICETAETVSGGLVHGFAGADHELLPAPTLRIWP